MALRCIILILSLWVWLNSRKCWWCARRWSCWKAQGICLWVAAQVQQEYFGKRFKMPQAHVCYRDFHTSLPTIECSPDIKSGRSWLVLYSSIHNMRPYTMGPPLDHQVSTYDEKCDSVHFQALALLEQDGGSGSFLCHTTWLWSMLLFPGES
jgi:hypothetical protein